MNGKEVLLYKAGRTPEGKTATTGHTASLAGDYMVCESCAHQAGAMVADTFTEFEDLFILSARFHHKMISGNRIAAVSGAGFEAVGMADSIQGEEFSLEMAAFSEMTISKLDALIQEHALGSLVDIKNPMDINPAADDHLHVHIAEVLASDPGVDGVIAGLDPMSPAMRTLPSEVISGESFTSKDSIAILLPELLKRIQKPIIGVVDSGKLYDPLVEILENGGLPVFRSADRAVSAFAKYVEGRQNADRIRSEYFPY